MASDNTEQPSTTSLLNLSVLSRLIEELSKLSSTAAQCILQELRQTELDKTVSLDTLMDRIADVHAMGELAISWFNLDRGKIADRIGQIIAVRDPFVVTVEFEPISTKVQLLEAPACSFYLVKDAEQQSLVRALAQHMKRRDLRIYDIGFALEGGARILQQSKNTIILDHNCWSFDVLNIDNRLNAIEKLRVEGREVR